MEDKVYAVIDPNGNVVNMVVWDGESEWYPPEGMIVIESGDSGCAIGWTYKGGIFTPPPAP